MIPIENLTTEEFNRNFKTKYLDGNVLDEDSLREIKKLFAIGDEKTAYLCCDDYHAHGFKCIMYYSPASGVVERLIHEIKRYQDVLSKISHTLKGG